VRRLAGSPAGGRPVQLTRIALSAVTYVEPGDVAAMLALVIYIGSRALLFYLRFRTGRWRTMELTEPAIT